MTGPHRIVRRLRGRVIFLIAMVMVKKNLMIFLIAMMILLAGCSVGEKRVKIFSLEEPRAKLNLPNPEALDLEKIKWIIITSENAQEVFAKLEAEGIDPVLFGLTDKEFELLAKNFAQIRQKLQETNNLLEEYKKYYEETE